MSLFSVKNSPLLVYCATETSQLGELGTFATKGHFFFKLLFVFINLPSADLSKKVKVRRLFRRNGSFPPGHPSLVPSSLKNCSAQFTGKTKRETYWETHRVLYCSWVSGSLSVSLYVSDHPTMASEGWAMAALSTTLVWSGGNSQLSSLKNVTLTENLKAENNYYLNALCLDSLIINILSHLLSLSPCPAFSI